MNNENDARIIADMMAVRSSQETLSEFVTESMRRAGRINPLPGMRALRLPQELQALNRKSDEDARTTSARVAFVLGAPQAKQLTRRIKLPPARRA